MARQYPYDTSADALLAPAKNAIFFADWDLEADTRNHDLLCAEMARLAYADEATVTAALGKIGFSPLGFFGGEGLRTRIETRGTQGFVAKNSAANVTVLAFRGTESNRFEDLFASDLRTLQVDYPGGGRVHTGFSKGYATVRERIATLLTPAAGTLLVTGHSLGAALATLAAMDVPSSTLITFGSPRVGDARFCARVEERLGAAAIHRFVDCCDVVARVPPERFDAANFSGLFNELGNFERLPPFGREAAKLGVKLAADALGALFSALGLSLAFAHAGASRYIRFDGTVVIDPTAEQRAHDQQAARLAYPHSTGENLKRVATLFASLVTSSGQGDAPRAFLRGLFDLARGDPVPLRDLADHAPINYLSGLAGRLPAAAPVR